MRASPSLSQLWQLLAQRLIYNLDTNQQLQAVQYILNLVTVSHAIGTAGETAASARTHDSKRHFGKGLSARLCLSLAVEEQRHRISRWIPTHKLKPPLPCEVYPGPSERRVALIRLLNNEERFDRSRKVSDPRSFLEDHLVVLATGVLRLKFLLDPAEASGSAAPSLVDAQH